MIGRGVGDGRSANVGPAQVIRQQALQASPALRAQALQLQAIQRVASETRWVPGAAGQQTGGQQTGQVQAGWDGQCPVGASPIIDAVKQGHTRHH
jgi:hypothetical protein